MGSVTQPASLSDPGVPELEVLLGADAADLLSAALAPAGGTVESVRISQVRYVPASSVTVQYRVGVAWGDGRSSREILVAAAGLDVPEETLIVGDDTIRIAVWRYPADPFLPGLSRATDEHRVGELLRQVGIEPTGTRLRTRAYRAGRRAVIEAKTAHHRVFIKVVRPHRIAKLQTAHVAMENALHVPQSLGWSAETGVILLQAMPGKTLRDAVESNTKTLPTGTQLAGLLDSIPASFSNVVPSARSRAGDHAALLGSILPGEQSRLGEIVGMLTDDRSDSADPVHGDFHASQVLVRGQTILGLIDVDTVGLGHRSQDVGNFLGHLATLALISPARKNFRRYGTALLDHFDGQVDPHQLRLDIAASILGLATGPFRVFEDSWPAQTARRLDLVVDWLDRAASVS